MTESQRLWDEHSHYEVQVDGRTMDFENLERALADYNPWITDREPTPEDGDAFECVEYWDGISTRTEKLYFKPEGRPWRKIVKPK